MLVVADTSVLLNLCRIREEGLRPGLFHSVQIPPAVRLHLPYVGTVGILIRAKRSGLIIAVQPLIEQLEQEAGYWISPRLRTEILRLAGE